MKMNSHACKNQPPVCVLLLTVCALFSPFSAAQPTTSETKVVSLRELVAYGLENNPGVRASRYVVTEADARARESRGAMLPSVWGEGSYTRLSPNVPDFDFSLPAELGGSDFSVPAIRNRYDAAVSLEQALFTGGRLANQRRSASLAASARAADWRAAEVELAFAIRARYWQLFEAQEALLVSESAVHAVEAQLANVVSRREQGMALGSDVLALQARLGETKLQALQAANLLRVSRLALNEAAGLSLDEPTATETTPPIDWSVDALGTDSMTLVTTPAVAALELDLASGEAAARSVASGWLPQLLAVGQYHYARPNPLIFPQEDKFTGTWQVGLAARWTLWDSGQTQARTAQARARVGQLRESLNAARRIEETERRQAQLELAHWRLATSVAEQNVAHAVASFAAVQRRFDLGAALTAELLDAEVTSRNAQLQHARAVARYGTAQAAFWRAQGLVFPPAGGVGGEQ